MVILNENRWVEDMIDTHSLGKKPFNTFSLMARYYIDKNYSKGDVKRKLVSFLLQCEPLAPIPKWNELIDKAISRALKRPAVQIDSIDITEPEIEIINALPQKQLRRLAFTLLCLAKYWDIVGAGADHWVNSRDNDIMKMANIGTSIERQSAMYHTLNELGLIQFSKKIDNTNVKVCFIKNGEVVLRVSDFRNLGYQYQKYKGEPFFICQNCGITAKEPNPKKTRGRPTKYCKSCAIEAKIQQNINSAMRRRPLNTD